MGFRIDTTRVNLKSETEFNFGVYGEISDVYSDGITRYVLQFDDWTAVLRYKQYSWWRRRSRHGVLLYVR